MEVGSEQIGGQVVAETQAVQQGGETDLARSSAGPDKEAMQTGRSGLVPDPALEQTPEQAVETIEPPAPAPKRVRKVRVRAPTDTQPAPPPDPNYWNSRLQEHRSSQRLAKAERYGNLRIM